MQHSPYIRHHRHKSALPQHRGRVSRLWYLRTIIRQRRPINYLFTSGGNGSCCIEVGGQCEDVGDVVGEKKKSHFLAFNFFIHTEGTFILELPYHKTQRSFSGSILLAKDFKHFSKLPFKHAVQTFLQNQLRQWALAKEYKYNLIISNHLNWHLCLFGTNLTHFITVICMYVWFEKVSFCIVFHSSFSVLKQRFIQIR